MVEDCWSKFAVPIQLKNCSATRKSNEHTKFLPKNANWALESKAETFRFATVLRFTFPLKKGVGTLEPKKIEGERFAACYTHRQLSALRRPRSIPCCISPAKKQKNELLAGGCALSLLCLIGMRNSFSGCLSQWCTCENDGISDRLLFRVVA